MKLTVSERLRSTRPVCMDGAMNTELSRKGLVFDTDEWLMVNQTSPGHIAEIHRAYARAGAEIHIANSFAVARHVLEQAGLAQRFKALNRAAVTLCRDAIDGAASHPQWIAGSISTYAHNHDRNNLPDLVTLEKNCQEQATVLARAGCDLIALEMLFDVDTSVAMLKGAAACGLPISIGLVCAIEPSGDVVLEGSRDGRRGKQNTPIDRALPRILSAVPVDAELIVSVMHSEIAATGPSVRAIQRHWEGVIATYPNRGRYRPPGGWDTSGACGAVAFADACEQWLRQGATIVGGCCGVGPEHIAELRRRL